MNGKPEKWCPRCAGTGLIPHTDRPCPCLRRPEPILPPVRCRACGGRYSPAADGALPHHGSIGWSCDGKTRRH